MAAPDALMKVAQAASTAGGLVKHGPTVIETIDGDVAGPINRALASCPDTGCLVRIPALGPVDVRSQILVIRPNVTIACDSLGAATLTMRFGGADMIRAQADNFELSGCSINGNGADQGSAAVHVVGGNRAKIHGNRITDPRPPKDNTWLGVRVEGCDHMAGQCPSSTINANYAEIYGNFLTVPWIAVSTGTYANYANVHDNYMVDGGEAFDFNGNDNHGGGVTDSVGDVFQNNWVIGGYGVSFLESVSGAQIVGNHFIGAGTTANPTVMVHMVYGTVDRPTVIANNTCIGNATTASCFDIFQNQGRVVLEGNLISHMGGDGILIDATSGPPQFTTIAGNTIYDSGQQSASGGFCAIRFHQSASVGVPNATVTGNVAFDDQPKPTQQFGLCADNTAATYALTATGNNFAFNGKGGLSLPGGCIGCAIGENAEDRSGNLVDRSTTVPYPTNSLSLGASGNSYKDIWLSGVVQKGGGSTVAFPSVAGNPTAVVSTQPLAQGNCLQAVGGYAVESAAGPCMPLAGSFTTTGAAESVVALPGMSPSGRCSLTPTNASAAGNLSTAFVARKSADEITVAHAGVRGM